MAVFLFYLLAIITVGSVGAMIFSRHQAYNALYLAVAFTALGGLFALLNAPFIAAVQILIYAGAIMVLFIFVIMMIDLRQPFPPLRKKWVYFLGCFLIILIFIELVLVLRSLPESKSIMTSDLGQPASLGRLLFTKYLYPFEITSVLIVVAIVGSLYLARQREKR
ncbi:MAG: NADH-quinone oxidoreductase subunit J [Candidatus Aminicenantes bacterium]|nr:NADH-quinone oxidoreductase subunit J [Candidatus Aminicenantes bacterium]